MKKLIYITLIAAVALVTTGAWANTILEDENTRSSNKNYDVLFRLDPLNEIAYVVFYGPATRVGDDVELRIVSTLNGATLQQEFFYAEGNGQVEQFSIEGLDAGVYLLEVVGEKYNKSQLFLIPS